MLMREDYDSRFDARKLRRTVKRFEGYERILLDKGKDRVRKTEFLRENLQRESS